MNGRIREIINYKSGGSKTAFAESLGWSAQYLSKLIRGESIGLQPILTILSAFPDIDARWLLLGQGQMLEKGFLIDLQRQAMSNVVSLFELNRFIPVMSAEELRELEDTIKARHHPAFPPERISEWTKLLAEREEATNVRFAQANEKSDELCKRQKAKK